MVSRAIKGSRGNALFRPLRYIRRIPLELVSFFQTTFAEKEERSRNGTQMSDSQARQQTETIQENAKMLKYLDFVQVAAIYVLVCFSTVYEYAKQNSGPLKSGVETVEATVKTVIGPVYDKFHDVPLELLKFVDRKVDDSLPLLVKEASSQARAVACEVQRAGVVDTAKSVTSSLYSKYEPVAEQYAVSAWKSLNRLPIFLQVAQIAVPTAAYWAEKYNQAVCYTNESGYAVGAYLPSIPIERISKVFNEGGSGSPVSTNGESVVAQ